jgi:site-specific recombinase XerD
VNLVKHLSRWLAAHGLVVADLDDGAVDRFVRVRRVLYSSLRSPLALVPLVTYLRKVAAGVPAAVVAVPSEPAAVMLDRFARYLAMERGLAVATVRSYVSQVSPFVAAYQPDKGGVVSVTARQVADFVTARAGGCRPGSVAVGANAVRALLRWAWRERIIGADLSGSVGTVCRPGGAMVPKALSTDQVDKLRVELAGELEHLRNEAMVALMLRLGLRAGEVAALRLDDIGWRLGVIVVHGKRGRIDEIPIPVDVGELLVAYLHDGRPDRADRHVFLGVDAPHQALGAAAVTSVAARALKRAGIVGPGAAHRLRHTAACGVLAGGGGLIEAGQLLRHSSPQTTAIYAKSDVAALAAIARPWPTGGVQ